MAGLSWLSLPVLGAGVFLADGAADPSAAFTSLGVGALVALPFYLVNRAQAARIVALELRNSNLTDEALKRERELVDAKDQNAALLRDAATALTETYKGMQAQANTSQMDVMLRRLEHALDEATKLPNRKGEE